MNYEDQYARIYQKLVNPGIPNGYSKDNAMNEFRSDLGDLAQSMIPNISVKEFGVIYTKAWEDGHSSGYTEVLNCFGDLVHFVKRLYDLRDKRGE